MKNNKKDIQAYIIKANAATREESRAKLDPFANDYSGKDILEPPYDLYNLSDIVEISNILPQCIEAMEQNCEGYGYNLICTVPEESAKSMEAAITAEKTKLENFFEYCNFDISFTKLRKKLRRDFESFGNAYLEVLRRADGVVDGFEFLKSITMRLCSLSEPVDVKIPKLNLEDYSYSRTDYRKRFRRYVQIVGNEKIYFKEFGDPRHIDAKTGELITEEKRQTARENNIEIIEATEVLHLANESVKSPYGVPRWIGNITSIAGSRSAEEINLSYFDNKAVPPLAILVSGGSLNEQTITRIREYIQEEIKGKGNFHNVMVLEAQGQSGAHTLESGSVKVEIRELSQINEARFLDYDEKNRLKIRSSFRLPPLYVGLSDDYTFASAKQSRETAEEQVFGPQKAEFDFLINRKIFPELGIRYHRFETRAAPVDNRKDQTDMIKAMGEAGLTVREVRKLLDKIADIKLDEIHADWLDLPIRIAPYLLRQSQQGFPETKTEAETQTQKRRIPNAAQLIKALQVIRESCHARAENNAIR